MRRRWVAGIVAVVVCAVVAACGSSTSSSQSGGTTSSATASSSPDAALCKSAADLGAVQTALDAERSQRSPQSIAALRSTIQTLVHDVRTMVNDVSAGC